MTRDLRIAYPGAFYHVMARGNEKKRIFRTNRDVRKFLKIVGHMNIRHQVRIHAYCCMPNHFHFIMETIHPNISKIMQELQGGYAMYFNTKYRRVGHLFQGRFKSKLVETDKYLKQLSRYIHRNPLEARIVHRTEHYRWSSYSYYLGVESPPRWLITSKTLSYFTVNSNLSDIQCRYRQYVENDLHDDSFENLLNKGSIIGSDNFKKWIKEGVLAGNEDDEVPDLKKLHKPCVDCSLIRRAIDNKVKDAKLNRKATCYLLKTYTSMTLKEIGTLLGHIHYKTVSKIISRFKKELKNNKQIAICVRDIVKSVDVEI